MITTENTAAVHDLELIAPVQGGQMLARQSGQVVFVHGGIPGELIVAGDTVEKRGYLEADAQEILRTAASRVEPPCPYFGENTRQRGAVNARRASGLVCGGCQYQHIDYRAQLDIKNQIIREQLRRVGKILDAPIEPAIPSPSPYEYRNKASWIVTDEGELAYHEARSHRSVRIDVCHLLSPGLRQTFNEVRVASSDIGLAGIVRGMEARSLPTASGGEEATLVLTFDTSISQDEATSVAGALLDACSTVRSIASQSPERGSKAVHIAGTLRIQVAFLDGVLSLSPGTFFQVNLPVAELMVQHVFNQFGTVAGRMLLDVYSGAGTFTVPLAREADAIIGAEIDAGAIDDTRDSLAHLGLENVTLLQGDAGYNLRSLLPGSVDYAVVDPPRSGCSPLTLRQLARIKAPRLVYVSCDPATLARDLRFLLDHGYQLESVQPFDLFPQTAHIESVSILKLPRKYRARGQV